MILTILRRSSIHLTISRVNFTQITLSEDGEQLDKAYGNFAFRKPNKFFWEHTKPFYHKLVEMEKP